MNGDTCAGGGRARTTRHHQARGVLKLRRQHAAWALARYRSCSFKKFCRARGRLSYICAVLSPRPRGCRSAGATVWGSVAMTTAIPGTGKSSSEYAGIYRVCTIPPVYTGIWARVVARQCAGCWKRVIIIYTTNVSVLKNLGRLACELFLLRTCERGRRARDAMQSVRANRLSERGSFVCV